MKLPKPFKLLLWIVVLLVVALLVVGIFADSLAKKAIEAGGERALGVKTTVDSCDIGFFSGTFAMENLAIANPEGYGDTRFLELGHGSVKVSALSLLSDKVEVPALELSRIRLRLVKDLQGSNYETLLDNLKRFQGASKDEGEGKRFVIERLTISDVVVTVVAVPKLELAEVDIPIERIELKNVGSDSDRGVLVSDLAGIVVEAVLKRASASGKLPTLLQGTLNQRLGGLTGLARAGIKKLDGILPAGQLPGGVKERVDDAKDALEKRLKGLGIGK